jgi:hypothetical protein
MVKPVKGAPGSGKPTQKTVSPSKTSRSLQTLKDAVTNFMTGRGKSALGAGRAIHITNRPPSTSSKRVDQAVKNSPALPSKKRSR